MLLFGLLGSVALAGPFVLLEDMEQKTDALMETVSSDATVLEWSQLQGYPLVLDGVEDAERCRAGAVSLKTLEEHASKAESALSYMEMGNVVGHIRQLENASVCADGPVPAAMLARGEYLSGVAQFAEGEVDAAKASWRRAFLYDSALAWDDYIEPSGKETFESVREALGYEPTGRLILVPSDAEVTVDGQVRSSGDGLHAGPHFVQHNALGHAGHRFRSTPGEDVYAVSFKDFSAELSGTMGASASREALLRGLQIMGAGDDIRVVAGGQLWTIPVGAQQWSAQPWGEAPAARSKSAPDKKSAGRSRPASADASGRGRVVLGSSALAAGAASLAWSFVEYNKFNAYAAGDSFSDAEATWGRQRALWWTGVGASAAGAGILLSGAF